MAIHNNLRVINSRIKESEKNDFYATEPRTVYELLERESFSNEILEPCVGMGHIANVLKEKGYDVVCSDLIDRNYPNTIIKDFFDYDKNNLDVITNPPYKLATKFLKHFLEISEDNTKIALFLKLTFLEGIERGKLFKNNPPKKIYVYSSRRNCARGGDFEKYTSSAVAYAWYIWEIGYKGETIIKWID